MKRITIPFLIVILTFLFTLSAFALTKEERAWKEDILTLLSLVKRVGDYSEVVDLIEVAPALKEDPEIRKAFVTFAPPGVTPPEWARGKEPVLPAKIEIPKEIPVEVKEEPAPPAIVEVPGKIVTAEITEKVSRWESEQVSREEERMRETEKRKKEKEKREIKEKEAQKIAQEVAAQRKVREREAAPPEIIKEEPKIETPKEVAIIEGPPEKIAILSADEAGAETTEKVSPEGQAYGAGRWESEQVSREEQRIRPTPLPKAAKVIHSTDVVSGVRAEMVEGKMRVVITLSGERKYTVSERTRPPSIIINIPHTINTVSPRRIMVNRGCVRMIEVIQYRSTPFDETRIKVILNRGTEYRITHKDNEIYIDFEE